MFKSDLYLPSPIDLLEMTLGLTKTGSNILFLMWYLTSNDYKLLIDHDTNPGEDLVFLEDKKHGYSVNDLKRLTGLTQASIQTSLSQLLNKNFVSRSKINRTYYYSANERGFSIFQKQIQFYIKALTNMVQPFLENSNVRNSIHRIKKELENDGWLISGWQEIFGNKKFIFHKNGIKNLDKNELESFGQDNHGKEISNFVSQANIVGSLSVKAESPVTSPAHVESQIFNKLWTFENKFKTSNLINS